MIDNELLPNQLITVVLKRDYKIATDTHSITTL
jgi:hypothetical protein